MSKRIIKIWDVSIGHNWSTESVIARDYIEAGRKGLAKSLPIHRDNRFVSCVKLVKTVEN
jgi:hypothetical protein